MQKVLREYGPAAEPAVIQVMMNANDCGTRTECACMVAEIGTRKKSSSVLQTMFVRFQQVPAFQQDRIFMVAATQAVQAIKLRGK